jgi:hypothetical protein
MGLLGVGDPENPKSLSQILREGLRERANPANTDAS